MEKVIKERPGYIIVLTLLIMAAIIALLTSIVQQSFVYQRHVNYAFDQTKARLLALSSLEIALSQLSTVVLEEESQESEKTDDQQKKAEDMLEPVQKWLLKVLPSINRWQTLTITEEGLEGTIQLYLACEEGKFNLAAFAKGQEFTEQEAGSKKDEEKGAQGEASKTPLKALDDLFKKVHDTSMYEAFKRFMNDYKRMPEDPTELLRIPYFAQLKDRLFTPLKKDTRALFIMDLFTFRPHATEKVNPWLLTASSKALLGIREKEGALLNEEFVKKIKPQMDWSKDWDSVLAPRYGKNFSAFDPALQEVFASAFEAKAFSMVSYCTVGKVTQRLYAVLEVAEHDKELSPKSVIFKVTKLYWL